MKKIMFAAALAASMIAVGSDVESGIVGYKTINVSGGTMVGMGVQFNDTTTENTVKVKELLSIPAADQKGANAMTDGADQIWVWDVGNKAWSKYFFRKQGTKVIGWCKQGQTALTVDTIEPGTCFFFKRPAGTDTTLTFTKPAGL